MVLAVNTPPLRNNGAPVSSADNIKVMVVDDSAVVRGLVSRWVTGESGMEIVARHANGKKAVDDVAQSKPDIIILDIEMPVMDGLAALPLLLRAKPGVRVVMASTLTQRNAEISMKALSLGATDYIPKPDSNSGITTSATFRTDLLARIVSLGGARRKPALAPSARSSAARSAAVSLPPAKPVAASTLRPFSAVAPRILVVGSSTGGPQALAKLFAVIGPKISHLPVVVTQHMPATFTAILAKHLGEASGRPSKEGEDRERLEPGHIYVAPGGYHMRLKADGNNTVIALDQGPEVNFCRPAVDPMFETASKIYRSALLAVILTGMGHDGAAGGKAITDAGGSVIAQDEKTSVVWGMPGAAAAAGICSAILPLPEIGPKINSLLK